MGESCSPNRVARLTRLAGIRAQIGYKRRPGQYGDRPSLAIDNTLDRRFDPEALDLATPASRYRMSPRSMPATIAPPAYDGDAHVRVVQDRGWITFRGRVFHRSKAFVGRRIALRPTDTDGVFDLCYRSHRLTQIDLRRQPQTVQDVPEQPSTMSPVRTGGRGGLGRDGRGPASTWPHRSYGGLASRARVGVGRG